MDFRTSDHPLVRRTVDGLARLNARHPWSHNDHFHPWILRNLPTRHRLAFRHTITWTRPGPTQNTRTDTNDAN